MPTKRSRVARGWRSAALSPAELQWLSGQAQPGANRFWAHTRGAAKAERCRQLLHEHAHLVPVGRMPKLLRDIEHWAARG